MKNYLLLIIVIIFKIQLIFSQQPIGDGKWLVSPTYDKTRYLDEEPELFPVADYYSKWGYIDKTGKLVIARQFAKPSDFSNGLAKVQIGDFVSGISGYVDSSGNWVWKSE